jgi:hypothetical protein
MAKPALPSRALIRSTLAIVCLMLPGCVPMMAAGVAGQAIGSTRKKPAPNNLSKPDARAACTARAEQYGAAHVIDVAQQTPSRIIVWGTAGEGAAKQSFKCTFSQSITRFTLRKIKPAF